ncbi:hypothetical protein CRENBAI_006387 [Crenichthys baileyi]|uniref:Uncharacterized protein n=1 Tax=Crenichthys baileyi TaxID=28760 RepID=A0AAV9RNA7_9TELE
MGPGTACLNQATLGTVPTDGSTDPWSNLTQNCIFPSGDSAMKEVEEAKLEKDLKCEQGSRDYASNNASWKPPPGGAPGTSQREDTEGMAQDGLGDYVSQLA